MKHTPISQDASIKSYVFEGSISDYHLVAISQLNMQGSNGHIIISLPTISNKVFMALTDADPGPFAELIASFNAESECNDALDLGYVEHIDLPFFKSSGWDAMLLNQPHSLIEHFPNTCIVESEEYEFHLLNLITEAEYRYKKKHSLAALMQRFKINKRDLFHFQPRAAQELVTNRAHYTQSIEQYQLPTHIKTNQNTGPNQNTGQPLRKVFTSNPVSQPISTYQKTLEPYQQTYRPVPQVNSRHCSQTSPFVKPSAPAPTQADVLKPTKQIRSYTQTTDRFNNDCIQETHSFKQPHLATKTENRNLEHNTKHQAETIDPLKIDLKIEPSDEFQQSKYDALYVGNRKNSTQTTRPHEPTHPVQQQQKVHISPNTPLRNYAPLQTQQQSQIKTKPSTSKTVRPEVRILTKKTNHNPNPIVTVASTGTQPKVNAVKNPTHRTSNKPTPKNTATPKKIKQKPKNPYSIRTQTTLNTKHNNKFTKPTAYKPYNIQKAQGYDKKQDLRFPSIPTQSRWKIVGETALGTLLLVGGLFTVLFFIETDIPATTVFPGVFSVAGLLTLASALKDALSLKPS